VTTPPWPVKYSNPAGSAPEQQVGPRGAGEGGAGVEPQVAIFVPRPARQECEGARVEHHGDHGGYQEQPGGAILLPATSPSSGPRGRDHDPSSPAIVRVRDQRLG